MDEPLEEQLKSIKKQIEELESFGDESIEICSVLQELRECYGELCKSQQEGGLDRRALHQLDDGDYINEIDETQGAALFGSDRSSGPSHVPLGPEFCDSDASSNMSFSSDAGSSGSHDRDFTRLQRSPRRRRKRRRQRAVVAWLVVPGAEHCDESLQRTIERARELRDQCGALDATVSRFIWGSYFFQNLAPGQLIAFAQRQLNGSHEWFHGIIKELVTGSSTLPKVLTRTSDVVVVPPSQRVSSCPADVDVCASPSCERESSDPVDVECPSRFCSSYAASRCSSPPPAAAGDHLSSASESPDALPEYPVILGARVVFAAPDRQSRVPCRDYDSVCPRGHVCRYSHGVVVDSDNLRPVAPGDVMNYLHAGCAVMFMPPGEGHLWMKGTVVAVEGSSVTVETVAHDDPERRHVITRKQCLLPFLDPAAFQHLQLPGDLPLVDDAAEGTENASEMMPDNQEATAVASPDQPLEDVDSDAHLSHPSLGRWEQYTKGFGSRMLRKMGYKVGDPLSPPSWKPGHAPRLVAPLPIRLLCPRVGLDFLNKDTAKQSGRKLLASATIDFQRSGLEEFEALQKKRQEKEAAAGAFGILNCTLQQDHQKLQAIKEREHAAALHATRSGKKSDLALRKELLELAQQMKLIQTDIQKTQQQLSRHTGASGIQQLRSRYALALQLKQQELCQVQERHRAIHEQLQATRSQTKLNIF